MEIRDNLDRTFLALADSTRRAILHHLSLGEATVGELAAPFSISQPAVSRHLKVLERCGLIEIRIDAQRRPRRIRARPLAEAGAWLEQLQVTWQANYQRLDLLLDEAKMLDARMKDQPQ
jgi:DNA-binding transcriptional ArsR family regulator